MSKRFRSDQPGKQWDQGALVTPQPPPLIGSKDNLIIDNLEREVNERQKIETSMAKLKETNDALTQAKKEKLTSTLKQISALGLSALIFFLISTTSGKTEDSQTVDGQSESSIEVSEDDEDLLSSETQMTPVGFTTLQIALVSLIILALIFAIKIYQKDIERDHRGSRNVEQISLKAFKQQAKTHTEEEVLKLQKTDAYRSFVREKASGNRGGESRQREKSREAEWERGAQKDDLRILESEFEKIDQELTLEKKRSSQGGPYSASNMFSQPTHPTSTLMNGMIQSKGSSYSAMTTQQPLQQLRTDNSDKRSMNGVRRQGSGGGGIYSQQYDPNYMQ